MHIFLVEKETQLEFLLETCWEIVAEEIFLVFVEAVSSFFITFWIHHFIFEFELETTDLKIRNVPVAIEDYIDCSKILAYCKACR